MNSVSRKKVEIIQNNLFEFDGHKCAVIRDVENVSPDMPPIVRFKIVEVDEPLHFTYVAKRGLYLSGPAGKALSENVLGRLLAINDNDTEAISIFINEFGYFFPASYSEYESTEPHELMIVVNRLKATVQLMNALAKRDYDAMMRHILFLVFGDTVSLVSRGENYSSTSFKEKKLIGEYCNFPDFSSDPAVYNSGVIHVLDCLYGNREYELHDYNQIRMGEEIEGVAGSSDIRFRRVVASYLGLTTVDLEQKRIIDLLYNFQIQKGIVSEIGYAETKFYSENNTFKYDEPMKAAIIETAKYVLREEINHNIAGIHPYYDEKFKVSWKMESLLQALYFSIFYMKPGVQIYKRCGNERCKRDVYFLIDATTTNKEYCCTKCANAAAQQRARLRKKDV